MIRISHFDMTATRAMFVEFQQVKTRGCYKLVFEVDEAQADQALQALGGLPQGKESRWCAICLLNSGPVTAAVSGDADQSGIPRPPEPSQAAGGGQVNPRRHIHEMPRSQQAALLCKDERFQEWILPINRGSDVSITDETWAAELVRVQCAVKSRADLDTHPGPAQAWDRLYAQYLADTGQAAEPR